MLQVITDEMMDKDTEVDEAWVEVTDDNEPIYAKHGKVAEAKIVDRIYNA